MDVSHDLLPRLVHLDEHLGFVGQLPLDVRSTEDALQVQPVPLALQPLVLNGKQCSTVPVVEFGQLASTLGTGTHTYVRSLHCKVPM